MSGTVYETVLFVSEGLEITLRVHAGMRRGVSRVYVHVRYGEWTKLVEACPDGVASFARAALRLVWKKP